MTFGVGPTGFTRPTLLEILGDYEDAWKLIFGATTDMGPDTPDGQILGLLSGSEDELWQTAAAIYSSFRPRQAVGAGLSDLVGLNGLTRKDGTQSVVLAAALTAPAPDVTLTTAFRMQSEAGDLWMPLFGGIYGDGTEFAFMSVDKGPFTVGALENWKILTPVVNLNSISNSASTLTAGTLIESDAELRARQIISTENSASNILEALYAAIFQVAGVTRVRIYVNETNGIVDGRAPHSYEVVVFGGADADIANAIWGRHPAGIELLGTTTEIIVDSQGFNQTIKFSRPVSIPIFVKVTVSATASYPATGDADMKQAIVDYSNGVLVEGEELGIGDDVLISRLYSATNSIPGHNVTELLIDIVTPPVLSADIVINEVDISTFTIANIEVVS